MDKFKDMSDIEKSEKVKNKFAKEINLKDENIEFVDYCGQVNIFKNRKMVGLVSFRTTAKSFNEQIKDAISFVKNLK